ncbi:MAG TPA: EamA family transporter, partial [Patescibacteria group bacterium]
MFLQGVIYGILGMFGWGTSDFFGAVASKRIGSTKTQFWSLAIGIGLFYILGIIIGLHFNFSQPFLFIMSIASLLQVAGSYFFLRAFQIGKISLVSPIASSFGMWTSIFALIFLHEHIT